MIEAVEQDVIDKRMEDFLKILTFKEGGLVFCLHRDKVKEQYEFVWIIQSSNDTVCNFFLMQIFTNILWWGGNKHFRDRYLKTTTICMARYN